MNRLVKVFYTFLIFAVLIVPVTGGYPLTEQGTSVISSFDDFDPLDEHIIVTVTIDEIRALKRIDVFSAPDFFLRITINDIEFVSDVWEDMMYLEDLNWSASCEVPKDREFVNVSIGLWDTGMIGDRVCDISPDDAGGSTELSTAELTYSIATGIWWGDDFLGDPSGYGRLSGIDDGSVYEQDRDCELWFDIRQTDFDGDGFPYWLEMNMYNTSPLVDNRGEDVDGDGIPIEWEHTFGLTYEEDYSLVYDPFVWEDHADIDFDDDGLNNIEEYQTWQWGSDPFRQDLFLELDQMELGPNGEGGFVPVGSFDLLRDSYARHNIVWHIDDGRLGGGEVIPFVDNYDDHDLDLWYWYYFMHQDINNWRRGVFHWGIIAYEGGWAEGFTFRSEINNSFALDCFLLSSKYHDSRVKNIPLIDSLIRKTFNAEEQRAIIYAGGIMHETGHSLNIRNSGVDNHNAVWPWQIGYWLYGPYKSVMNYRYIYTDLVDYSDGSRGDSYGYDFDDWGTIDLANFNPRPHW